jgi:hypothetical protein
MDINKNKKIDEYWTVEEIRPYIIEYLQERFPDSIIMREFDDVDIIVLGPGIPVEIQKTYIHNGKNVRISEFEDNSRRQIEINIRMYGVCWFFLDQNFLDYLECTSNRLISLDMKWLYENFKQEKVKIFSITRNGIIRELNDTDLNILTKFSVNDIDKNRHKIAFKILKKDSFSTEEINDWYDEYERDGINGIRDKSKKIRFTSYLKNENSKKKRLYYIMQSIGNLRYIKEMLACNMIDEHSLSFAANLGIIEGISKNHRYNRIRCSDNYNILEYFSEYFEKKELWDYLRTHTADYSTFLKVVRGEYPDYLRDRKYDIDYYFGTDKNINNSDKDVQNSDDINITIKNKDNTIDINIKSTKQANIEDSWS